MKNETYVLHLQDLSDVEEILQTYAIGDETVK